MCTKLGALFLLWALIITSVCGSCPADRDHINLHDEGKLHDDLLCAYKSDYRPVKDHKTSIQVNVLLGLKYINFDSLEETFTVHSWVVMKWKDEFLTWTPSNYGDIKELQMESHEIWVPKMSLLNADASIYQPDGLYTTCLVANDGTVTCVPHIAYSGICKSSLRRWPYDVQNCTLNFASWMHTGEQINYTSDQEQAVVLHEYNDGPGWKLLNVAHERIVRIHGTRTYPKLTYTFVMKREAAGPAAIVVVPSVVVVLLTLTSLLLDVKDNVRLMLICFSLFGHFLFLTEIGNDIPKHSSDTPIILLFVRDSMIITLVAIFETLLLISLRKRTLPAPTWIVSVTRLVTSGPGKYVVFTEFDPNDLIEKNIMAEDATSTSKEERSRAASDWIQFANLLNSFIFIISVFLYLVLILVYIPRDD